MQKRILHIAPFNISGVPITFVKAERKLGFTSRLITLGHDRRNYEEDICLQLPFLDFSGTRFMKKIFSGKDKLNVKNVISQRRSIPPQWQPNGPGERALFFFREFVWKWKVHRVMQRVDFWNYDIYQLDGGLEFYRSGSTIRKLKSMGKTVICCYTGSDLRTRGVIPEIDRLSDLNLTLEFDHLHLHPDIHHVFFPFPVEDYSLVPFRNTTSAIKIGHAPTNRMAKGSALILAVLQELKADFSVVPVLIENLSHEECIRRKSQCDIFIDQIGDLGYGLNSLESLAMGIPTCSCLAAGFNETYPEHPFVEVNEKNLKEKLVELIRDVELRKTYHEKGRTWVKKHHDYLNVVKTIHKITRLNIKKSDPSHHDVAANELSRVTL